MDAVHSPFFILRPFIDKIGYSYYPFKSISDVFLFPGMKLKPDYYHLHAKPVS